jgi:hypothetical protein
MESYLYVLALPIAGEAGEHAVQRPPTSPGMRGRRGKSQLAKDRRAKIS